MAKRATAADVRMVCLINAVSRFMECFCMAETHDEVRLMQCQATQMLEGVFGEQKDTVQ